MTDPLAPQAGSPLVDQVANINARLNDITTQRTTYVAALVTANGTTTFDAKVSQPDGTFVTLAGIGASRTLMPAVGTTVSLALSGAQVVLVPSSVADGSLTIGSISSTAPSAPTGLTLSTASRTATDGTQAAIVTASWTAPTTLVGGGAILGSLTYMVQYRVTGTTNFSHQAATAVTSVLQVTSGVSYDVEVAAVDQLGNVGAFTAVSTITSAHDTAAPGTPSTPVVTNYLGQLKITWDGLIGGAAPPADFAYLEVHTSATTGFTPSSATLVGDLSTAGSSFATASYTTTMFAKFVAVDTSGNKSGASLQGSGSTSQVVSSDIFNGAVGSAQLASLAVTTAKIALLAVNDAQIGNMSVGKLTAGTISVDVVVGGRFTTALTGARVEMNASGLQKFDGSGNLIVSITGTSNVFRTANSGRRLEIGAGGTTGIINFIASSGTSSFVQSFTESGGSVEDIQIGVDLGGHQWWNRIFINDNGFMGYHAITHQFNILNPSNSAPNNGLFVVQQYNSSASFTTGLLVRMIIDQGFTYRDPPSLSTINFAMTTGYSTSDSIQSMRMVANAGGGAAITTVFGGVPTARIEFRDVANTVWYPITGGTYTVGSSRATKLNVADYTDDAMATVRAARPRTYQRVQPDGPQTNAPPFELGLVAEEAPPVLVNGTGDRSGVDLYALATLTLAAVQQLDARLAVVEKKGPPGP